MKVILQSDVKKVGQKGSVVEVADGYAQNVLIPKKLAIPATGGAAKQAQDAAARAADKRAIDERLARATLAKLDGQIVTLTARANEKGSLFKAVTAADIVQAIEARFGLAVPVSAVILETPIKKTGDHTVTLALSGAHATLTLQLS